VEVVIDHAYGTVTITRRGQIDIEKPGKTHSITTNDPVSVVVTKTNTALFIIQHTTESPENVTASALKSFLAQSKPYLVDLGSAALNALGTVKVFGFAGAYTLSDSLDLLRQKLSNGVLVHATSVSNSLQRLNALLFYSPSSVRVIELKTMETLRHLDPTVREQFYRERDAFKDLLLSVHAFSDVSLARYNVSDSLISCWEQLNSELGALELQTAISSNLQQTLLYTLQTDNPASTRARLKPNASNIDSLVRELKKVDTFIAYGNKLISEAGRALDEKDANLRVASEVEHIAQRTAVAECEVKLPDIKPDFEKDQILHIKICQSEVAKRADFPALSDVEYDIRVQSEPGFRASLGIGLAGWFGPTFNDYAAFQVSQTSYVIGRKAPDLSRFRYVATLSILFNWLDWTSKHNSALWFPEITIGPANDLEGLGVGAAYAIGKVKIGLGALWVKHIELDGQTENQTIPSASALRTRKTYGRFWNDPKLYLSISVFDIPPFIISK
jgi:hypothetical protein